MVPQMNDEPRYGQRSSDSEPISSSSDSQQTPWPQYGAVDAQAETTYGSYSGAQAQQNAQTPDAVPQGWAGGYPVPVVKLPGRAGPIALMIVGVLVAVIVAPVAFFVTIFSGISTPSFMNSMTPISSGDTVQVDESGVYVVAAQSGDVYSCDLRSASGVVPLEATGHGIFIGSNLTEGTYTVECQMEGTSHLLGITGVTVDAITGSVLTGLLIGTVIGLIGCVMLIAGIVWIVMVGRRRKAILKSSGLRS